MSEPDNDKSTAAAAAADEDDGGGSSGRDDRKKHKREGRVRKAKKSALFRFRKLKNQLQRKKRRISSSNLGCLGERSGGCCLSLNLKKSPNLDSSSVDSQTSDPNNPDFTLDLLRGLIEKNDFYSTECNTHFDIDSD